MTIVWKYADASDHLLDEDPAAFVLRIPALTRSSAGSVFLCQGDEHLDVTWDAHKAVLLHYPSMDQDPQCAVTELSLDLCGSISKSDRLWWNCNCCGVGLGIFRPDVHIGREAAFEILAHILTHGTRPDKGIEGPIIWTELSVG